MEIAARRASELQRADERRDKARGLAVQAVDERLQRGADRSMLPGPVEAFLRRPWCQYQQQSALRDHGHGAAVSAALALGDAVLAQCRQAQAGGGVPAGGWLQPQRVEFWMRPLPRGWACARPWTI
ncbi:DUF1631 domain-containing protein, partial [Xanthomonas cerealis]|uniref:DUF1631 domain-containing protein n=1 Tax=Xanthomonas cerealis TaxID=3390025 RepID=UPI000B32997D